MSRPFQKLRRVSLLFALPLLMRASCGARAVGPAPVPTGCFGPAGELQVYFIPDTVRPATSPVVRITWMFTITCDRSCESYSFGVRQDSANEFEEIPDPAGTRLPSGTVLRPSVEPFHFVVAGRVRGDWCVSATVEFMDGAVQRIAPYWRNESRNPLLDIVITARQEHGVNIADYVFADSATCRIRRCP